MLPDCMPYAAAHANATMCHAGTWKNGECAHNCKRIFIFGEKLMHMQKMQAFILTQATSRQISRQNHAQSMNSSQL